MKEREKWVAISGGFDPVHIGHINLLKAARELGDRLVVIVNNDNWLRVKKGFAFMPEAQRAEILRSFRFVDKVVLTDHEKEDADLSVCRSLAALRPSVFANGGDRGAGNIPESALCHEIGIELAFNVGGDKVDSSSWLVKDALAAVKTDERPWGSFQNHYSDPDKSVHLKTLHVNADAKLSLQRHRWRNETWVLVHGDAQAVLGVSLDELETIELVQDEPFRIPTGYWHRLMSRTGGDLVEISYGSFDEDDIERAEDIYGRI